MLFESFYFLVVQVFLALWRAGLPRARSQHGPRRAPSKARAAGGLQPWARARPREAEPDPKERGFELDQDAPWVSPDSDRSPSVPVSFPHLRFPPPRYCFGETLPKRKWQLVTDTPTEVAVLACEASGHGGMQRPRATELPCGPRSSRPSLPGSPSLGVSVRGF